jgi:hypothetical protein
MRGERRGRLIDFDVAEVTYNGYTKDFNINLAKDKDTFGISDSWMYKYAIFDMIEIYKYFDWENYLMVVYGG